MNRWKNVAIVGVGLIGGSIGLALRQRGLAQRVVGIGRRESSLSAAKDVGAVDDATTNWKRGLADAELVVVCTPVGHIVDHVRRAADCCPDGTLITDAGSTKQRICEQLEDAELGNCQFIGSHPMAGSEESGPQAARADLFDGRLVIVTPTANAPKPNLQRLERFWQSLGAHVVQMSPAEHDRAVAAVSHLPHVIASALSAATPEEFLELTSTGWADTTRIAAGDVELWRQILSDNRGHVLQACDNFATVLASFREALAANDAAEITRLLQAGKQHRDAVGS